MYILRLRTPFQVLNPIIGRIAVFMVNVWFIVWIGNECFCNSPMNKHEFLFVLILQGAFFIPLPVIRCSDYSFRDGVNELLSATMCRKKISFAGFYLPGIGDPIGIFETFNRPPIFFYLAHCGAQSK